jgi:uncharacterized Tic20 family protein
MKISLKIWLVISILLVLVSLYGVFNTRVSLTYEVYEPLAMGKVTDSLKEKEENYKAILFWLWILIGYISINVIYITILLRRMKKAK